MLTRLQEAIAVAGHKQDGNGGPQFGELLCEQCGTGEQAMRSVGGNYQCFLVWVGSVAPRAAGLPKRRADSPLDSGECPAAKAGALL